MAKKAVSKRGVWSFRGVLQAEGPGGSWMFMTIPFDTVGAFGGRGRISVVITFGGTEFRTSIFPKGDGVHHMMVNKAMRAAAGAKAGDTVDCTIRADTKERTVEVPAELKRALAKNRRAKTAFEAYSWSHRKEYCDYVSEAKREETREKRVVRTLECILEKKRVK